MSATPTETQLSTASLQSSPVTVGIEDMVSDACNLTSDSSLDDAKSINDGLSSATRSVDDSKSDVDELNSSIEGLLSAAPKPEIPIPDGDNHIIAKERRGLVKVENLQNFHGATVDEKLVSFITETPVIMFSRSDCEFSNEAKRIFTTLQADVHVLELDRMGSYGASILNAVKRISQNCKTVPVIYLNGTPIGGCTELKALQESGELVRILRTGDSDFMNRKQMADVVLFSDQDRPWETQLSHPWFGYPHTLNNHTVRVRAVLVFCIGVLGAVLWDSRAMHWVVAFLLCDSLLTLFSGGSLSILASFSDIIVHRLPMDPISGPPKQFTALCDILLIATSTALFFGGSEGTTTNIIGATFCGLLAILTGLEGFLNFCVGSKLFDLLIRLGWIRKLVYKVHIQRKEETVRLWTLNHEHRTCPDADLQVLSTATREAFEFDGTPLITPAAYSYKVQETNAWRDKFNVVRHMQVAYFAWPVALTSCAVAFSAAETTLRQPFWIWQAIGVGASGLFLAMLVLYILRSMLYPRKVYKEWSDPQRGPLFGLVAMTISLLAALLRHFTLTGGTIFAWTALLAQMCIAIVNVGRWLSRTHDVERVHQTWLLIPVGIFFTSSILVAGDPEFFEFGLYLFGAALLLWLLLFAITLLKHITTANTDERLDCYIFLWVALPALASNAWSIYSGVGVDLFARLLFGCSIVLVCCLLYTVTNRKQTILGHVEGSSVSGHIAAFSVNVLALTAISVDAIEDSMLSRWLAYVLLICGAWLTALYSIQSIGSIIERKLFRPESKWNPLTTLNGLTHESIISLALKLVALSEDSKACINPEFLQLLDLFERIHRVHAQQEDDFVSPTLQQYVPELAVRVEDEHIAHREAFDLIRKIVLAGAHERSEKAKGDSDAHFLLQTEVRALVSDLQAHLDWTEKHLHPICRKYVPWTMQKAVMRRMWEGVPSSEWRVLAPVLVRYMPYHHQRVQWCRAVLWAMPERGEQLGLYLYHGVSDVEWSALQTEVPELSPRTTELHWSGWNRYY